MQTVDDLPYEIPPEGVVIQGLPLKLVKIIGRGGQGIVYLARPAKLNRFEVVKFPEISPDAPDAIVHFQREINALARLSCDSIVTIYSVDVLQTVQGPLRPYFTMEYLEGGALKQRLTGEPFPVRRALSIAIEIADALSAAHAAGIVHRDIKPQNVLFTRSGKTKLIDFGLARLINESKAHTAGFIRGTPKYMSPEAARAEIVGPQGDLYSLGVLLFEMLTGRAPFQGASEYDLMLHHAATQAPSLRDIGKGGPFPPELEGLMRSVLAKRVHDRPQSAGEFRRQLESIRRLLPDDGVSRLEDVDSQDATLSAALASVHQSYPPPSAPAMHEVSAATRDGSRDAATLDDRRSAASDGDTGAHSVAGRVGVVAKSTAAVEDDPARRPPTVPRTPLQRRPRGSGIGTIALIALVGVGGVAAGIAFSHRTAPRGVTSNTAIAPIATIAAPSVTTSLEAVAVPVPATASTTPAVSAVPATAATLAKAGVTPKLQSSVASAKASASVAVANAYDRAKQLMNDGDLDAAEREARSAIATHGIAARLLLGDILERKGKPGLARDVYRKVLETDPDNAVAKTRLAKLGG